MGVLQFSMLWTMKSLRDEFQSLKETSKGEVDQTSSASKPGTSKQPENLDPTPPRTQSSSRADEAMDVDYMVHPFLLISEVNSPFRTLTRYIILVIINLCMNLT